MMTPHLSFRSPLLAALWSRRVDGREVVRPRGSHLLLWGRRTMNFVFGHGPVRRLTAIVGFAGLSLAMASCTPEGNNETSAERGASDEAMPTIYVDRLVELGQREGLRDGYLQALANCREGGLPIAALSEEEVKKIGTERWQLWRGPGRRAYREESWAWGYAHTGNPTTPADLCNFKLFADGQHGYLDAEESIYIDLGSNERSTLTPEPGELELNPARPPTEEELAVARDFGISGPVDRSVSGQPCQEWTFSRGATVCIWSGGAEWGFAYGPDDPLITVDGMDLDSIILHAEPAPGARGARLMTTGFTINAPLNLDDMKAVGAGDQPENRGP